MSCTCTCTKRFTAFLSFADQDRELVEEIHKLFLEMHEKTYFAPEALPRTGSSAWRDDITQTGSPAWRDEIINGIHQSRCFVPIYSRHSINRPWVLYESGLADSIQLPRFPVRVADVDISEIEYLPKNQETWVYSLSEKGSLVNLLANVCASKGGNKDRILDDAERVVNKSIHAARIVTLSKTRWVFIAGNIPKDKAKLRARERWFTSMRDYTNHMATFADRLTKQLLAEGFSVAACSQVPAVGRHVINTAARLLGTNSDSKLVDYRISGIYPIDREARETSLSKTANQKWLSHIMEFRKSYLRDQEWLLTIGGSEGTMEEYTAAKDCKVKVLPIPCFGGSSLDNWKKIKAATGCPCKGCQHNPKACMDTCIKEIVSYLKQPATDDA